MADLTQNSVYRLIAKFDIELPDGRIWRGSLWRRRAYSKSRRFQVHAGDELLFDSEDCHDHGNARHKLETWLAAQTANAAGGNAPSVGETDGDDGERSFQGSRPRLSSQVSSDSEQ